jgi:plasmid stabilization system protein ParE
LADLVEIRAELARIVEWIGRRTGLVSAWSGELRLENEVDEMGSPARQGRKHRDCWIGLHIAYSGSLRRRVPVLVHEALHSFSAGYCLEDYEIGPGYEEGVVSRLTELLLPECSRELFGTTVRPAFGSYREYVKALEVGRALCGSPMPEDFYRELLGTRLALRYDTVLEKLAEYPLLTWRIWRWNQQDMILSRRRRT